MDLKKLNFLKIDINNKKMLPFLITAAGCTFFLITTIVAMFFYPDGYNFFGHFFSDLGTTMSRNGAPNPVSFVLFNMSVIVAGSLLFPFFLTLPKYISENKVVKGIAWFNALFGAVVAIAYIGIGFTPADIAGPAHGLCVRIAFLGTVPVILVCAILTVINKEIPRYVPYTFIFFTIVAIGYVILLFSGIGDATVHVVGQKIIIYTEMISMVITGYGMAHYADR